MAEARSYIILMENFKEFSKSIELRTIFRIF